MIQFRFAIRLFGLLGAVALAMPAHAEDLGEFGDWSAVKGTEGGKPLCYISAQPQKSEGNYKQRGQVYAIITHRPAEKSIGVVSFQAGYALKGDTPVTVTIDGKKTFSLFGQDEFAWTREADDDKALGAAMRNGSILVVNGTSARGTLTTDTYSLSGFTAAINAINTACGVK
ncbi:MAG: invasion associated locus B family protein [Rhodospirillales bacterium]|nr:invasion associated locus B family protein [Rhodospirillales bacterium]